MTGTTVYRAEFPADLSLVEELACEDLVEMANLTSAQTGVPGTIFISTAMGAHGPRVKYFVRPGRTQPSFSVSIADAPTVVANSLPARTAASTVAASDRRGYRGIRTTCSISGTTATPGRSRRSTISSNGCNVFDGGPA